MDRRSGDGFLRDSRSDYRPAAASRPRALPSPQAIVPSGLLRQFRREPAAAQAQAEVAMVVPTEYRIGFYLEEVELYQLTGALLLQQAGVDVDQAEACFQQAWAIASR